MTRRIALVSGHFPPSNLVGAQRARLWSRYLPEFGWDPIVVTGDPAEYEERPDPDLERLLAPGLRVVHAKTLPTRPVRLVGDIGIRSFWGCYRVLARMAEAREIDFVMVTIPSNFLAPVGRLVHLRHGVPFGIDYQDPWVNRPTGNEKPFSRAWASNRLAEILEPWSVRDAALITGMAPGYVSGMLERNQPGVRLTGPFEDTRADIVPIGCRAHRRGGPQFLAAAPGRALHAGEKEQSHRALAPPALPRVSTMKFATYSLLRGVSSRRTRALRSHRCSSFLALRPTVAKSLAPMPRPGAGSGVHAALIVPSASKPSPRER